MRKRSQAAVTGLVCSLVMSVVVIGQVATIGRRSVRDLLSPTDVGQITRLATSGGRVPWLFDVSRGMLLPTEWYVDAYLSADTQTATLRRGRFTKLESRVIGDIAQNWRVVSRSAYAQVARPGNSLRVSMTDDDIDRPFRVEGRFSDEELVEIVSFVRSSPRKPSLPPDPDGTIRLELPDEIDGKLPVAELVRTGPGLVRITLKSSDTSGQSVLLERVQNEWMIREITSWIA